VWPTDAEEHRQLDGELRAALGDRYEQAITQARTIDLGRAVAELVESDPWPSGCPTAVMHHLEPRNRPPGLEMAI
jgi:hypothetical protein